MPGRSSSASPASSACRRTVLRGAALVPAAGLGIAACSTSDDGKTPSSTSTDPVELGPESDVHKGGAKLYQDEKVVVSRGKDGSLKAFSAICTHQGCSINDLQGTELICPCHGSKFDATNGKVLAGPAGVPLTEMTVTVRAGKIVGGAAS